MASGQMDRVKRPDTRLHRPMLQNVKKVLANPEPSTHDPIPDVGVPRNVQSSAGLEPGRTITLASDSSVRGEA
jgi:hypothetical protein